MNLTIDARSQIPIRQRLTEQLKHVIETAGVPRDPALPSIRKLAGLLGINTNTVARVIEDLKRSGHVEARRGRGVFVASGPPGPRCRRAPAWVCRVCRQDGPQPHPVRVPENGRAPIPASR